MEMMPECKQVITCRLGATPATLWHVLPQQLAGGHVVRTSFHIHGVTNNDWVLKRATMMITAPQVVL
jgi:hypothetical protein